MTTEVKPSYFQERMQLLGITEEQNKIGIWQTIPGEVVKDKDGVGTLKTELVELPVFRESPKGIDIFVYTLDRNFINYKPEDGSRYSKNYCLTRLKDPIVKKDGSEQKYYIPKGQGTYPFFHPMLIEKFEKKEQIDTLFVIEGYFKAWKGCMHGLDVVGVSSITHLKEKETGLLHIDIRRLRDVCGVKRMVWLTDGDCLDITGKELKDGLDLYKRPKNFYSSCENFKNLLDDWEGEKWFYHIDTDNICSNFKIDRKDCKGLDDLLISMPDKTEEIVSDAKAVLKSHWFVKMQITIDTRRIYSYFHLINVNDFYLFHIQRRKDLKDIEFQFNGTRYKYDDKDKECKVVIPAEAKQYFRVGDTYYKKIEKVNQFGEKESAFEKRLKTTITDDHGLKFPKHIPKFEAFCNVPGHMDHHAIIHNSYNVYFPFEHEPDENECTEADCPYIMNFLKHIFGEHLVTVKQPAGHESVKTAYYQLGLDYIQLLYQKPTERLPILCLVSRENETGKSTFGDLMKAIFTNNATVVGNSDLADDFNSFWATKLLIMCDETKIDKQAVVEKVKSLTFAKKIGLNAKGKDKIEIDFFGKFMFFTNNEENFIYASEEDLRYWVIKVPRLKEKNPDFLKKMIDEIPQFLSFLNRRKIVAPRVTRMWFDPELLKTEALRKVIANSHSTVKKELTHFLREMFLDFGVPEIYMTCRAIKENFFRNKEENYIERVLKEEMRIKPVQWWIFNNEKYEDEAQAMAAAMATGLTELEAIAKIEPKGRVLRHQYPRFELRSPELGKPVERVSVWVKDLGRAYRFDRKQFVADNETVDLPPEMLEFVEGEKTNGHINGKTSPGAQQQTLYNQGSMAPADPVDDLPF